MKNLLFGVILILLFSCEDSKTDRITALESYAQIIPKPRHQNKGDGKFILDQDVVIQSDPGLMKEAKLLKHYLSPSLHFDLDIVQDKPDGKFIHLIIDESLSNGNEVESYSLEINEDYIQIKGCDKASISRGIQTLRQCLPIEFAAENEKRHSWILKEVEINDQAKFRHRGVLLDCCRHFFDVQTIKKQIDLMALYKMNVLHWHLTEDQGWRIEIDAFPKLTEIGAYRNEKDGSIYGGFYTKDEIRDIVSYAEARHITIIPEIEMPGHSQAALAAYPQFSCKGKEIEVINDWGVFKEIYCAGNDSTFVFLEKVLDEVMDLFPSEYIHIGGDEAPKTRWEKCSKCQSRILSEGLHDEHELQSYFIQRIEKYLNSNGRKLIGWDEILEGGLAQNAVVQSWRGMEGGIQAAELNHDVIMSPTSHCYFDYDVKTTDMEQVYSFDPIPAGLDTTLQSFILGGECNLWSEHIPDSKNLDQKIFPRILAMSEVLWSISSDQKNYSDFQKRVQTHYPLLNNLNVDYGLETHAFHHEIQFDKNKGKILLSSPISGSKVSYQFNCKDCPEITVKKDELVEFDEDCHIKMYVETPNGIKLNESFDLSYHKAIQKPVQYHSNYNEWYTAGGDEALVNSEKGSLDFRDGNWQGFWGEDMEVVIDLEDTLAIAGVESSFYQYNNAWIFMPKNCQIDCSMDGENWTNIGSWLPQTQPENREKTIEKMIVSFDSQKMRFLRVKAQNFGQVPDWHEAAGSDAWIFIDEISLRQ